MCVGRGVWIDSAERLVPVIFGSAERLAQIF